MRRTLVGLTAAVAVLMGGMAGIVVGATQAGAASDVVTYLGSPAHPNYNAAESTLTAGNLGQLTERWSVTMSAVDPGGLTGYISTQPIVSGGLVYWGDSQGYEHATNATTGAPTWSIFLGTYNSDQNQSVCGPPQLGVNAAATVASVNGQNLVLVGGGGAYPAAGGALYFFALNAATGAVVWKTAVGNPPTSPWPSGGSDVLWSAPVLYNNDIYFGLAAHGDCPHHTISKVFELSNAGAIVHSLQLNTALAGTSGDGSCIGGDAWGTPTIDTSTGMMFVATGDADPSCASEPWASALLRIDLSTFTVVAFDNLGLDPSADYDFGSTPVLFSGGGKSLVGVVNKNGTYYAWDRTNLSAGPVWSYGLANPGPGQPSPEGGEGSIAPAEWDGTSLYTAGGTALASTGCTSNGTLTSVSPATGAKQWIDCLDGAVLGAPAGAPGFTVVGAGNRLEAYNTTNGASLWSWTNPTSDWFWASPTIADGWLYAANSNGSLYAFSLPASGAGVLTLSASSVGFGSVTDGTTATQAFSVSNTGGTALAVTAVSLPSAPFVVTSPLTVGTSIKPGQTLSEPISFSPSSAGPASGSYSVTVNDGLAAHTVSFSGTGVTGGGGSTIPDPSAGGWQLNGSAVISGSTLQLTAAVGDEAGSAFWPTAVSSTQITATYTAQLNGGTGADGLSFILADATKNQPTALGALGGGLGYAGISGVAVGLDTWQNWNSNDPSNNFVGIATGYGVNGTSDLTYVATNTTIPALRTGTHVVTVTVLNGNEIRVVIDGTQYLDKTGLSLPPNVLVGFGAGTGGNTDIHAVSHVTITAGSTSAAPGVLTLSASSVGFGSVTDGTTATQAFSVSNTGGTALAVTAVSLPSAPFVVTSPLTVGTSIKPGQTLSEPISFSPSSAGPASGSYSVTVNDGLAAHTVSFSGTGVTGGGGSTIPDPSAGGWQLNGSAVISGSTLQLTAAVGDEAGSAFWPTAVSSTQITATYTAQLNGGTGADGLSFILADATKNQPTALGALGGGLGYAGISGVAVGLDTWQNWNSNDPSNNFVGIATGYGVNGTSDLTYVATNTTIPALRTGTHVVTVTVLNGNEIRVVIDGTQYLDKTGLSLPPNVLVGFGAGTGGNTDIHAVSHVTITT